MHTPFFQTEIRRGEALIVGKFHIVPLATSVRLLSPGGRGGVIWNRPTAVEVTHGAEVTTLPIYDRTRILQFLLLSVGLLGILLSRLWTRPG
jgi:hypothetical protein